MADSNSWPQGVPDWQHQLCHPFKWKIALELCDRAAARGVTSDWLTFDDGHGGKPLCLQGLDGRKQRFIAEVPTTFSFWT
uniref:transposase n=1 Tax=Lacipirellula limnantheis TaxID=2528024 RepID=UPI00119DDF36|nr:transposase [Lacipirellula limnantheis]